MLGWMVTGFVIAGAATWLVLYPPFARDSAIVRIFLSIWFWLTLLPLALFFVAVWIRVDAYGLTAERVLLVASGTWAALLAAIFLVGRGDIRFIPGFAAVVLLAVSIGPWNFVALPVFEQGARLSRLLAIGSDPTSSVSTPKWNEAQRQEARSAISYLMFNDGTGHLDNLLLTHGIVWDESRADPYALMAELGNPMAESVGRSAVSPSIVLLRDPSSPVELTATPYYVGHIYLQGYPALHPSLGLATQLLDSSLVVMREDAELARVDLHPLHFANDGKVFPSRGLDFVVEGRTFRLVGEQVTLTDGAVTYVDAMLFSATAD
jgi:hypothetical protein